MSTSSVQRGLWWCLPPAIVSVFIWLTMGGRHWDPHLPVTYSGDGLFYLAQSKATIDHGWWWFNRSLGMPFGLSALLFAQDANVDQAIVWLLGRAVRDVFLAVNLAWIAMVALSSITAAWGLRRLGVSRATTVVAAVIFAASPFAFYRNIDQLPLVTYLLPFPLTVALILAAGEGTTPWSWRTLAAPMIGCALLGLDFIYPAFFGAVMLFGGLLIGFIATRSRALLRNGVWCLGALLLATALNLVPNAAAWRVQGTPQDVDHSPAQSEEFGLKLRHLVSPLPEHTFAPFRAWLNREAAANYPGENENHLARLGVVPAACCLGLLTLLVFPSGASAPGRQMVAGAAALVALALLVATVGGFGAVFSLLVSSSIRGYNRIAPCIAFIAIAGGAVWCDRVMSSLRPWWRAGLLVGVMTLALADQRFALAVVAADGPVIADGLGGVTLLVKQLEARLPADARVFQLPVRPFPADPGTHGMGPYAHFRPYLSSTQLRWSYPTLTSEQITWEQRITSLPPADMASALARQGFAAILISRSAYDDEGKALEAALLSLPGTSRLVASDDFLAIGLTR